MSDKPLSDEPMTDYSEEWSAEDMRDATQYSLRHAAESFGEEQPHVKSIQEESKMNSLFVIAPYDYEGLWVFDDARVGLEQEPFVAGADTMIDALVADIPNAKNGFRIVFSASAFPGYTQKLDWVRPESSGNVYRSEDLGMEGWLCPALFKYFESAPKEIYLKVEAKQ